MLEMRASSTHKPGQYVEKSVNASTIVLSLEIDLHVMCCYKYEVILGLEMLLILVQLSFWPRFPSHIYTVPVGMLSYVLTMMTKKLIISLIIVPHLKVSGLDPQQVLIRRLSNDHVLMTHILPC